MNRDVHCTVFTAPTYTGPWDSGLPLLGQDRYVLDCVTEPDTEQSSAALQYDF